MKRILADFDGKSREPSAACLSLFFRLATRVSGDSHFALCHNPFFFHGQVMNSSERRASMILLYTMMLFILGMFKFTLSLRAKALERKYMKLAGAVDTLLRQAETKPGNSNKVDPCTAAKRTLHLGQLVEQRDRVEAKHVAWQIWAEIGRASCR